MYAEDTFFHLSMIGRIGLVFLSTILAIAIVFIFLKISNRFGLAVKGLLALVLIWSFIWLSPQIYYLYYLVLFENLPLQIVVGWPPGLSELFKTICFAGEANFSNHSKGILFWIMIAAGLIQAAIKSQSGIFRE